MPSTYQIQQLVQNQAWTTSASGSNAVATATMAASGSLRHFLTRIDAGYTSASNITGTLQIFDDTTLIASFIVRNALSLETWKEGTLLNALRSSPGKKLEAKLSAGGTGVDGWVTMMGFSA